MAGTIGNKNAVGNSGGARPSAYKELINAKWLADILEGRIKLEDVEPRRIYVTQEHWIPEKNKKGKEKLDRNGQPKYKKLFVKVPVNGFSTVQEAIAYHLLTGNEKIISKVLDKLVASKTDMTSGDKPIAGGFIMLPGKDKK